MGNSMKIMEPCSVPARVPATDERTGAWQRSLQSLCNSALNTLIRPSKWIMHAPAKALTVAVAALGGLNAAGAARLPVQITNTPSLPEGMTPDQYGAMLGERIALCIRTRQGPDVETSNVVASCLGHVSYGYVSGRAFDPDVSTSLVSRRIGADSGQTNTKGVLVRNMHEPYEFQTRNDAYDNAEQAARRILDLDGIKKLLESEADRLIETHDLRSHVDSWYPLAFYDTSDLRAFLEGLHREGEIELPTQQAVSKLLARAFFMSDTIKDRRTYVTAQHVAHAGHALPEAQRRYLAELGNIIADRIGL